MEAKFFFKLGIVQKRLHILYGRIKILEAIAEVIKIIQELTIQKQNYETIYIGSGASARYP